MEEIDLCIDRVRGGKLLVIQSELLRITLTCNYEMFNILGYMCINVYTRHLRTHLYALYRLARSYQGFLVTVVKHNILHCILDSKKFTQNENASVKKVDITFVNGSKFTKF
jgi:hypothetical protein